MRGSDIISMHYIHTLTHTHFVQSSRVRTLTQKTTRAAYQFAVCVCVWCVCACVCVPECDCQQRCRKVLKSEGYVLNSGRSHLMCQDFNAMRCRNNTEI